MKTLQIIDHLKQGGAQRMVIGILNNLPTTKVIPLRVSDNKYSGIDWGIAEDQYFFTPGKNNIIHLGSLLKMARLIVQEEVDIVHFHLLGSWLFSLFLYLILPSGKRPVFLYTEHSLWLSKFRFYPVLIRTISKIGYLIPESEFSMDTIISNGGPLDKTFLLHNFIDLDAFSPRSGNKLPPNTNNLHLDPQTKIVGFAGRLVPFKRWDYLLDIADLLRNENIVFLIAGDGAEREKVHAEIISRQLSDKVFMLGYINSIAAFYHSLDLYISLSESESFGLSIMEAQACGVPVMTFESPFSQELGAGKAFLTIEPHNIRRFAEGVVELLDNQKDRQTLISLGLENAKRFSLTNYIKNIQTVYISILEREGRAF